MKEELRDFYVRREDSPVDSLVNLLAMEDAAAKFLLAGHRGGGKTTELRRLDGLDEVFDQSNRVQVVQQIDRLVNDYRTNKFVITSRIAGYQEAELGNRFREFTITPMGNAQIQQFLERWCLAIEVAQRPEADASLHQRDAARESQGILHAIETKPGVKRFAANPLLLTILALIHRNGTQMPQRRVELYALATKTLIEDWQLGRNAPYGARQRQLILVEEEVTALLAPLAFQMHEEKPSGLVTQAEVEEWLTPKMAELQGVDEPAALELVKQFLRKVRETTGLFVERAPTVYGFMHLTFEEYFAARHIADNEIDDILRIISPYRNQARWNEPILLALGYLSADQKRVNRLVEQLFSNLAAYQPAIVGQEIRLKNASADHPVLVWTSQPEGEVQESDSVWQDLLFVGQVLAEVKVTPKFCRQQVEKLVLTYLGLDKSPEDEPTQQLLKLLRGIEVFNHQVLERLQQAAEDECLSDEQRSEALAAMLYVACGDTGETLIDHVTASVQQLTPSLFNEIRNLVEELGAEMTPALEQALEDKSLDATRRKALEFMTGLSYLRAEQYDHAIARLQPLVDQADCRLDGFIHWAIAIAYEKKDDYDQGLQYYQQCSEKLQSGFDSAESLILWRNWGWCYRLHKQYEQSLDCFQQALAISKQSNNCKAEASILWNIGRSYQAWGKYEQAIAHYEQSRELYQQLGKETSVANQWFFIGDCYREWGKYQQALEAQQQDLTLRQRLDDQENIAALEAQQQDLALRQRLDEQKNIARAYSQLGRIYQAWGKYEQALTHHEQSRDLYQHLGKETDVADSWYWIGVCYREWGKYQQALEAQQQDLALRQRLDDQKNIARAYYQLGRIYQAWGKYEQAIAHHEQSRELYQHLGKETDVADSWYWIAVCYREWGKYQQALEAQQQDLTIRQRLDDQKNIADAYYQLGRIYQAWGKYEEALAHHEQSRDLYATLDLQQELANRLSSLATCYRESKDYTTAIDYYQNSIEIHQALGHNESAARRLRQLSNTERQLAKNCSREEATALLQQAEHHLQQAIQLNTTGDYRENLAYDHIALALLSAEHLRWLPENDASVPDRITQFEQSYTTAFTCFTELGQAVDSAEEALDIARAYLEISPLENLDRAESLAHHSLQTFQDFNRRKLEAAAYKLLGEIYLARAHRQESGAIVTASQFLTTSLHLYREVDLTEKVAEVEQLMTE